MRQVLGILQVGLNFLTELISQGAQAQSILHCITLRNLWWANLQKWAWPLFLRTKMGIFFDVQKFHIKI